MKSEVMLELLEAVAVQLAIKVSYETLAASVGHGGLCRVNRQYRVIIDKRATASERVAMVASAVASFDLSNITMTPKVREVIRFHEGSARLKLPRLDGPAPVVVAESQYSVAASDGVVEAADGADTTKATASLDSADESVANAATDAA